MGAKSLRGKAAEGFYQLIVAFQVGWEGHKKKFQDLRHQPGKLGRWDASARNDKTYAELLTGLVCLD